MSLSPDTGDFQIVRFLLAFEQHLTAYDVHHTWLLTLFWRVSNLHCVWNFHYTIFQARF